MRKLFSLTLDEYGALKYALKNDIIRHQIKQSSVLLNPDKVNVPVPVEMKESTETWQLLGQVHKFDPLTVQELPGDESGRAFTAVVIP